MNFGYSVGDVIAVLQLAITLRERFRDAPEHFKAISNEMSSLSNVLQGIERVLSGQALTDWQNNALVSILQECHNVLIALGKVVDENYHLDSAVHGIRDKSKRIWKRLTLEPTDIQDLRSRVALNIGLLNAFNGSLINKVVLETSDGVQRLHLRQDRRERKEQDEAILEWLTPITYAPQQQDFISRRQTGTGQWLLDSPEYQAWLDGSKQTLYCPGIPGAGKTILTSVVVDDLTSRFRDDPKIGVAYLFCNFKRKHEQKLEDLLLNLLKQLAQGQLAFPDVVKTLYNQHKRKQTRPSIDEVKKEIQSIISDLSNVYIIIDALDECQGSDGSRLISDIFDLQVDCEVNFFTTSRFIPEIADQFMSSPRLEVRASENDLRRYLDGQMVRLPKCVSKNPELQEEIKRVIVKTVDGMFLLAQLHLDSLTDKTTPRKISRALEILPKGSNALDIAYEEAIQRIRGQEAGFVGVAFRVLSWITCALRPLSGRELQHALAVESGDSELGEDNLQDIGELVSLCAGLVTIDEEGHIIRLVHYTTQEYFERTQDVLFPQAQKEIAETCITYLSFDKFESGTCLEEARFIERINQYALYSYAAENWGHHIRATSSDMERLIMDFLGSERKVSAAGEAILTGSYGRSFNRIPRNITAAHLAARFGLSKVISLLAVNGQDLDCQDGYGETPLFWAIAQKHEAAIRLLLDKGADIESKNEWGRTPLSVAIEQRRNAIIELLLDKGADTESKDIWGQTPLSFAVEQKHNAIIELLLDKGANIESKDEWGQTPLSIAVYQRYNAIIELLLDKGASTESKDKWGQTPLSIAASKGYYAVIKPLLDKGANIESKDKWGQTPLSFAASKGHNAIIELLLDKGADIESKDEWGQTPLSIAASKGHNAIIELLLDKGADIESKDDEGQVPLWRAIKRRHEVVVKILLDKGAKRVDV